MITTLQTTLVSIFPHLLRIWRRVIYKPFSTMKSEYPKLNENLNIIYGQNGSGKSSYVRLFKHLCGSKNSGSLYGNVYKEDTEQNCNIKYNINGEKVDINWSPHQGSLEDLNHIEIYDA